MGKIRAFWQKYESKLVLALGLVLVAGISFQAGYLQGQSQKEAPIVFENTQNCPQNEAGSPQKASTPQNTAPAIETASGVSNAIPTDCLFVGSKNSTKYHLPTCSSAKRIKPENIVCFKSDQEALSSGYEPSKDCINSH
ncbi:MAG: Ada metal-binding domain-containing protein [Patescibacteria group bacterium]